MDTIKIGFCNICEDVRIWDRDKRTGRIVKNEQYCEFSFTLDDGMIYRHSACINCINTLTDEKVQKVIGKIKESWKQEMVGWATDKQFKKVNDSKLVAYHEDEKEALKIHEEKEKEKQDTKKIK